MKKILIVLMVLVTACMFFSCKSNSAPLIEGEVTQDKVNDALGQIYDTYRTHLDLTDATDYIVVHNDNLSKIARDQYGALTDVGEAGPRNGFYFPVIMLASEENTIVDPDLIEQDVKLVVPDLKKNILNPTSRQAIIDCLKNVTYVYTKKAEIAATDAKKKEFADTITGLEKLVASLEQMPK